MLFTFKIIFVLRGREANLLAVSPPLCCCFRWVLPFHSIQFHNFFTNTIVLSLHLATLYTHHLPSIQEIRKWYDLHNCVEEKKILNANKLSCHNHQQIHSINPSQFFYPRKAICNKKKIWKLWELFYLLYFCPMLIITLSCSISNSCLQYATRYKASIYLALFSYIPGA